MKDGDYAEVLDDSFKKGRIILKANGKAVCLYWVGDGNTFADVSVNRVRKLQPGESFTVTIGG